MKVALAILFVVFGSALSRSLPNQPFDLSVESLTGSQVPLVRKARQLASRGYGGYTNFDYNPYNDTPNNYDSNQFNDSPHRPLYNNFDLNPFNDSPNKHDGNPFNDSGIFGILFN